MRNLLALLAFIPLFANAQTNAVFMKRLDGYRNYRIPALVCTSTGTLLAFCEGRQSLLDQSENDIVLKRSLDNGKTWDSLKVVVEDGANSLNNPQVVVRNDGRVILHYQRYTVGFGEKEAMPGLEGEHICRVFQVYSVDDGKTWSAPEDVTRQVKRPEATSIASGPGIGIELKNSKFRGRLVMPYNQGPWGKWSAYCVYSDDGGSTWIKGELTPLKPKSKGWANEIQIAELPDGRLIMNARSQIGNHKRKIAYSEDGGRTWSPLTDHKDLMDPMCQGSMLCASIDGMPVLIYCGPKNRSRRIKGTIYVSKDGGTTWPIRKTVYKEGFAYSCMTQLPNGNIGLLFEKDGYETISFLEVGIKEIVESSEEKGNR